MAYYLKDLPFTEEGKKLNLSDEDRERFRLVYKKEGEDWILHDIFGEGDEYGDDCIVVPLESVYNGYLDFDPGWKFANVVGSVSDPKPNGHKNWIGFWSDMYKKEKKAEPVIKCYTDSNMYGICPPKRCICNTSIIGGHIILGEEPKKCNVESTVYIVPICKAHNNQKQGYMQTAETTFAAKLIYGVKQVVHTYLAQHPLETHEKI